MRVDRVSRAEAQKLLKAQKKPHKYHAKPVNVDGVRFASRAEAAEYRRLMMLCVAGRIALLELQPVFELHAPNGEVIGKYVADFHVVMSDGEIKIIDVKGFRTPMYRWKKRHVEAEYGIRIEEVR